jgi:hypothetical protein
VQLKHGAALAANGNLVAGAADAHDGTGRAEEGDGNLFLAASIYDTPPGVVNKYQVIFPRHDVTPVCSLRKGELPGHLVFACTRGHVPQIVSTPSEETSVAPSCSNSTFLTSFLRRFSERTLRLRV